MVSVLESEDIPPTNEGLLARLKCAGKPISRRIILYDSMHIDLEDNGLNVKDLSSPIFIGFMRGIYCAMQHITHMNFGLSNDALKRTYGLTQRLMISKRPNERRIIVEDWFHKHLEEFGLSTTHLQDKRYRCLLSGVYRILQESSRNLDFGMDSAFYNSA